MSRMQLAVNKRMDYSILSGKKNNQNNEKGI